MTLTMIHYLLPIFNNASEFEAPFSTVYFHILHEYKDVDKFTFGHLFQVALKVS